MINKYLSGVIVPIAIVAFAIFFLVKLRGRPFARPSVLMGSLLRKNNETGASSLRAVMLALAGTLGVGNIVGVASAIVLGGAGALFWMWISAVLAMILKYCEVVLALRHRRRRGEENYGGAMYYMRDYFESCQKHTSGYLFCLAFVILCLANGGTMGCIIQSNAIATSFNSTFCINPIIVGAILALLTACVFFFKAKGIFAICEKLVPIVSFIYIAMSLYVIASSYQRLPQIFSLIFDEAFSFRSLGAGAVGFLNFKALRFGTIRGLFSNEAGCGTSPIAHATANTDSPCEQGFLGIAEVFIDTIVVCTMTGFVILLNGTNIVDNADAPMVTVLDSFEVSLGNIAGVLLSICVFLFAFATIICWGYYGKECIYYLNKKKKSEKIYYCVYVLLVFLGAFISLDTVWEIADFAVGAMTVMNLFILGAMNREVVQETDLYYTKRASRRKL